MKKQLDAHVPFPEVSPSVPSDEELSHDEGGHVICPTHPDPDDMDAKYPFCQYRKTTIVEGARRREPLDAITTQLVYNP